MKLPKKAAVRNWESSKMVCFNKKAQALTELAAFGSILLLVLSFLISYGMRYNYQQDLQMRSFRRALSEAYASNRPDASSTVTLIEDKHVPDPRDMFGVGNIVPVQATAEATWGNTMQDSYKDINFDDLSQLKYVINNKEKKYTTSGYTVLSPRGKNQTNLYFYTDIPGRGRVEIMWADARTYNPAPVEDPDNPGNFLPATQIKVLIENDPATDRDNETEIVSAVSGTETGPVNRIVKIFPESVKDGDPVDYFLLLSSEAGEINPYYFNINNPGVNPDNIQGVLLNEDRIMKRKHKIALEKASADASGNYKNSSSEGEAELTVKRSIRTSSKIDAINSTLKR